MPVSQIGALEINPYQTETLTLTATAAGIAGALAGAKRQLGAVTVTVDSSACDNSRFLSRINKVISDNLRATSETLIKTRQRRVR
jgi:hypothetical protein